MANQYCLAAYEFLYENFFFRSIQTRQRRPDNHIWEFSRGCCRSHGILNLPSHAQHLRHTPGMWIFFTSITSCMLQEFLDLNLFLNLFLLFSWVFIYSEHDKTEQQNKSLHITDEICATVLGSFSSTQTIWYKTGKSWDTDCTLLFCFDVLHFVFPFHLFGFLVIELILMDFNVGMVWR